MPKEKVLIVDDEELIRWSLREASRSWGYSYVEAAAGSSALSTFEAEQPSAVLLDVNLPDGSGLDVLREIKQRQPDAVVIMITGNVLVADTIAALRGGGLRLQLVHFLTPLPFAIIRAVGTRRAGRVGFKAPGDTHCYSSGAGKL